LVSSSSRATALLLPIALVAVALPARAVVFHSQAGALELAFPEAERIETDTYLLTKEQVETVQKSARSRLDSRIAKFYIGWKGGERLGYAFIDVHNVRTLPEAFMVVLALDGSVSSLRVLAFHEPLDYLPSERWFDQFGGKTLADPLRLGRDVHGIMGAPLSTRAVTDSVRRVLALYDLLLSDATAAPGAADAAVEAVSE
jgi:hypothetical protein